MRQIFMWFFLSCKRYLRRFSFVPSGRGLVDRKSGKKRRQQDSDCSVRGI